MERAQDTGGDSGDMSPDEFRRYGHMMVVRIARYLEEVEREPDLSRSQPGAVRASLRESAPRVGGGMEAIIADFDANIAPGLTHRHPPGFMAYFALRGSGPGILGEMLTAGFNVNAMVWRRSPAATELEEV